MNRQNMKTPEKTKTKIKPRKKEPMQTKQSVINLKNQRLSIASTVIAAFGLVSIVLAAGQSAQAQNVPPGSVTGPVVFQAAGPDAASIQSTVDAFRAALGDSNGNNPGPLPIKGRREINWDGGNPSVLDTTAPVNPFLVFLNTRGSEFKTPGL